MVRECLGRNSFTFCRNSVAWICDHAKPFARIVQICAKLGRSNAARVRGSRAVPPGSLGAIVQSFKAAGHETSAQKTLLAGTAVAPELL
jgi:hypothetical protein